MTEAFIRIEGARQNNLKNLNLSLPLNELTVITGVSGSGKSSLAFDTVYAEGQRRYVETFSPYARQFLDRMDKPLADRIDGIPPAIAIDQTNPVRTSRSTVGTMTELNDHLKLLFARAAQLYCRGCGNPVRRDSPDSIYDDLLARIEGRRAIITFALTVPKNFTTEEVESLLARQGYARIHRRDGARLEVVQDRVRIDASNRARIIEALEGALKHGREGIAAYPLDEHRQAGERLLYSNDLRCADCNRRYRDPIPSLFSFNSPVGACDECRGFGRTMGIDYGLVIPDPNTTLAGGAIKTWQSKSYRGCQRDLMKYARERGIPIDVPWKRLKKTDREWVLDGEGRFRKKGVWYGVRRFFAWLETKAYKMHIRVLLSKYRSYNPCSACDGARLKADALDWRVGALAEAQHALGDTPRFKPTESAYSSEVLAALPGVNLHDMMLLPIERLRAFFDEVALPAPMDEATELLLDGVRSRLRYLTDVGLGYLTLDRQSRTLSGGEVQRINLTTALGTSLVNALFVLDEPSIGLHARDMDRVIGVLHRLRDAGNTLLVVEHDAQVMLAADRILDLGPGPGRTGWRDRLLRFAGEAARIEALAHRQLPQPRSQGGSGVERRRCRPPTGKSCGPRTPTPSRGARRDRAQLEGHRRRHPAQPPGVRHRCIRLGQVHPGRGHLLPGTAQARRPPRGSPRPASLPDRPPHHRGCGDGRPVADRQDHTLQSRELRRRARCDPQGVREHAARPGAGLPAGHLQLQLRHRPLSDLLRQRLRAYRDAIPERRLHSLRELRRTPLPRGDPRGEGATPGHREGRCVECRCMLHRRRSGDDRDRGDRLLCRAW